MKGIFITLIIFQLFSFAPFKNSKPELFVFIAEDVFQLSDGRLVVSGQIKSGNIKNGDKLVVKINNIDTYIAIQQMEIFGKPNGTETGVKGDFVAFTVSGVEKEMVGKGTVFLKGR
jgi:translation elongation factor EF-1alpha